MRKAFIFDMDGVLVNSEPVWEKYERIFLPKLLGRNIYQKIKDQIFGNSITGIYEAARQCGASLKREVYVEAYDENAKKVYQETQLTPHIIELIDYLLKNEYSLGLVSSARKNWMDLVLERLDAKNKFNLMMSLNDLPGALPKPAPDGYNKAMGILQAKPVTTMILEDSGKGVEAARASKAFTICLTTYVPAKLIPTGANLYVKTINHLMDWLRSDKPMEID